MKYINHMTSAHNDDKHISAMYKMGLAAYGAYWVILEKIASQIRPESVTTSMRVPHETWSRLLRTRIDHATRLLRVLHETGLIICEFDGEYTTVSVPNLLKYGDEYTKKVLRKSIESRDKVRTHSGSPAVPAVPALPEVLKEKPKPKARAKKTAPAFVLPDSIRPEVWQAFEEHRVKKRAPMTDRARQLMVEACAKIGGDPNALLEYAILSGWQKVFPIPAGRDVSGEQKFIQEMRARAQEVVNGNQH